MVTSVVKVFYVGSNLCHRPSGWGLLVLLRLLDDLGLALECWQELFSCQTEYVFSLFVDLFQETSVSIHNR